MPNPQQPELRRSETIPALHPDATGAVREAEDQPSPTPPDGPVPEDQRPGRHDERDEDTPDLDAFAQRLGIPAEDVPEPAAADDRSKGRRRRLLLYAIAGAGLTAVGVRTIRRLAARRARR